MVNCRQMSSSRRLGKNSGSILRQNESCWCDFDQQSMGFIVPVLHGSVKVDRATQKCCIRSRSKALGDNVGEFSRRKSRVTRILLSLDSDSINSGEDLVQYRLQKNSNAFQTRRSESSALASSHESLVPIPIELLAEKHETLGSIKHNAHNIVLCHRTVDFDSLAAAVGLAKLRGNGTIVVIPGGESAPVKAFLSLYAHKFPIVPFKLIDPQNIDWIGVVDTQRLDRLGAAAEWIGYAERVSVYDHHVDLECDLHSTNSNVTLVVDKVGAVTTLIVESLQREQIQLSSEEATLFALAIHADTGSCTFETTTFRDVQALAWLIQQGANQRAIQEFLLEPLSTVQQSLLALGLDTLSVIEQRGRRIARVLLVADEFVKGMASVTQDLLHLSNSDALLLGLVSPVGRSRGSRRKKAPEELPGEGSEQLRQLSIIGRAKASADGANFHALFAPLGGGGHAKAAAASIKVADDQQAALTLDTLLGELLKQLPKQLLAGDVMRSERQQLIVSIHDTLEAVRNRMKEMKQLVALAVDSKKRFKGVILMEQVGNLLSDGISMKSLVSEWIIPCPAVYEQVPLDIVETALINSKHGIIAVVYKGSGILAGIVFASDLSKVHEIATFS
uniref:DDH domain-containing protein n=1 Tax=Timspurckia oligopyrenoides TaxID=708627 RepID=A0A7S0ZD29_9RHOD|mmetsp:Transcript_12994/g.23354  ORF Transcript_12994/g.23354 Transcript_12994/m.23354 type:complete len:618 (+) Transcript_12994:106-1959(+)